MILLHPSNALSPIEVIPSWKSTVVSELQLLNIALGTDLRPAGRTTVVRLLQPENALSSMDVTLSGISRDVIPEFVNAFLPIVVSLDPPANAMVESAEVL